MASPSIFVFNEAYYLAHNPDVAAAVQAGAYSSGLEHWQAYGQSEGRPASAFFDLQVYKDNNPDLNEEAGFTTDADYIRHFSTYGYNEPRVFLSATVFNAEVYAAQNPDLGAAELTSREQLEAHFKNSGLYEGRITTAGFDPIAYINANADLKALLEAGGNINGYTQAEISKAGWFHYLNFGISEGRTVPTPNPTITLTSAATSILEGSALEFTVTLSVPLTTDTTFTYNVTGDTNGGTVDAASTADFGAVSGSVTIPAGSTSYKFTVTPTLDTTLENLEGFKVTLFNGAFAVVATKSGIILDNSANAPQNFTLTTGAESVTGGASNDTVTGVLATDGSGTTINAGDNINLGGGTDTVNISVTGATAATVTSVTYTGVENVLASNFATANTQAFDLTLADSSLSKVGLTASSVGSTTKFTGVKQIVAAQMAGGGNLTLDYSGGVSGTADVQTLTLTSVTDGKDNSAPIFTADKIETLNIASTGSANELTVAGTTLSKVVVTGNQALSLGESTNALNSVDASALTAALTFVSDNTADFLVKGGAGDDSITLTGSFTAADTVDGGAGNDTLTIDNDVSAASVLKNVSNVEHLVLSNGNDLTLAANVSVTDFTVGTGAEVTFDSGYTAATTLTLSSTGAVVANNANTELSISGSSTNIAAATITGGTGADTLNITAGGTVAFTNITKVDKIVVVDAGDTASKAGADIVLNLGAYGTALTIDASALDAGVSSATDTSGETLTVDGSSATVKLTVTGGAAADTITGGSNNDVINGGDGDDSIVGTAGGNDSVSGGAGNDTFNFGSALTSGDTIDGGDGVDTLIVTSISGSALANVTNVENLALAGAGSSATLSANLSFTSIDMASADNNAQTLTLATGYTNATTVAVDAGDKVENNANVALTVNATDADLSNVTITGGTGVDTLNITAASNGGTAVDFVSKITKVDVVNIVDGGDAASGTSARGKDIVLTLGAYATALKIDGTALDAGTLDSDNILQGDETLNVSGASVTANLTILAGGGADTLISGSGNDSIVAGAGNDSIEIGSGNDFVDAGAGDDFISVAAGNLNAGDTIDGGEGNDVLELSSGDVNDTAVFSNVKNVETLKLGATAGTQSVALSTNAGSFSTIDISAAGDQVLTLNIGYTSPVTVVMTGDSSNSDKIVNAAGVALTVVANAGDIDSTTTIQGGSGTDTLKLKADGGSSNFSNVTGVEVVTVVDGGDATGTAGKDITLDLGAYGSALTIDASALDGAVATATDSSGETLTVNGGSVTKVLTVTGGAGNDTIETGSGDDVISGGDGADSVIGGAGNDSIDGGAGADSLSGGTGNDTILGGAGNDTISGGQGSDLLTGGANADTFVFKNLNESFGSTIDTITDFVSGTDKLDISDESNAGRTVLFAGNVSGLAAAQLAITATTGTSYLLSVYDTTAQKLYVDWDQNGVINNSDMVISLAGTTSLVAADVISTNGAIIGTNIADDLQGTSGNDVFFSLGGNDTVTGGAGNDTLVLSNLEANYTYRVNGVETITGGTGNDVIIVTSTGAITVNGSTGSDSLTLANGTNTVSASGLETITGGTGADAITLTAAGLAVTVDGSTGNDSLTLANGANTVSAANLETITGGTGDDAITLTTAGSITVNGSTGSDSLTLANGTNTVSAANLETITGGTGNDAVTLTTAGTYTVNLGSGSDSLTLANGTNTVSVSGVETITGGTGDDAITLSAAGLAVTVAGGDGNDILTLSNGANTVSASGFETINGGTGDDAIALTTAGAITVSGSTGSDSLTLADGTNTVSASGIETISGGGGNDAITLTTNGTFTVSLSTGDDSLTLAGGGNTVSAQGIETITGGSGADLVTLTAAGTFTVNLGLGNDSLTLANGTNTVSVSGIETITGGSGVDNITLTDTSGAHTITGGSGADVIVITGSTGADTIVIASDGGDTVTGFTTGTDVLDFDAFTGPLVKSYEEVATVAGDITTDANVIVFGGTTDIATAAAAVAADATVTGTTGLIVIYNGTNTLVYGTTDLGNDGTETLLVTLTGVVDPLTLVSADFLV